MLQSDTAQTLLTELLAKWEPIIGADFAGYKNHCHRMVACCLELLPCTEEEQQKIAIAACFHDIGLWTANTLDYIPPSVPPAVEYLRSRNAEDWSEEVSLMITEHHKLRAYTDTRYPLVEIFRRADLADFSLGIFAAGLSKPFLQALKAEYPNAGFHKTVLRKAGAWFIRNPLNPVPMMKW